MLDSRLLARATRILAPASLAIASFALLALSPATWPGLLAGWAALAASWWAAGARPLGRFPAPRAVVAAGFLVQLHSGPGFEWPLVAVAAVTFGLLLTEAMLASIAGARFRVENLSLPLRGPDPLVLARTAWRANTLLVGAAGLAAAVSFPVWTLLVPATAATAAAGALFVNAWNRRRRNRGADLAVLQEAVARYEPKFLLYFSAPQGMHYQATMWLPHLERVGEPFVVVLREGYARRVIASATSAPVVVCPSLAALDAVIAPSVRAVFYVNNGMKNSHCVRFAHLLHVQLLHGDSDKAPSFNPVTAMFDRIFVAGQAGIDRYAANGVDIPSEKFRIVGRPQVADLAAAREHVGDLAEQVVLYAPTWIGLYQDANYSSLPIGEQIVRALLDRGATVIVRHHPFAMRDRPSAVRLHRIGALLAHDRQQTGRQHLWGAKASTELTLFECIDRSHAMVSDVSSVASDYLFTGKPFAITDMLGQGDVFRESFPLAAAAYVIGRDGGNIPDVLDQLLGTDPLAQVRHRVRTHYLGDIPVEGYADAFVSEVRACLEDPAGRLTAVDVPPRRKSRRQHPSGAFRLT